MTEGEGSIDRSRRKPRRNRGSAETRARLLDTALRLFRKQGFDQTTMRQIASASGMALGAAYYYFSSKEALVMAFYERAQDELEPLLQDALLSKGLESRLSALLEVKFRYFQSNRSLLGALSRHIDPQHSLSPFSEATRPIRERDIGTFIQVLEGSTARIPPDLRPHLPRLLWLYQMGLLLFWVYDSSEDQVRTKNLVEKSLPIVVLLIKLSTISFLRPLRKRVVDLLSAVNGDAVTSQGRREL